MVSAVILVVVLLFLKLLLLLLLVVALLLLLPLPLLLRPVTAARGVDGVAAALGLLPPLMLMLMVP